MSASSNLAAFWLSVIPSPGLNLHLEFQTALKWWLGIDIFGGSRCPSYSTQSLDPLGHHALTCRYNGDVVSRHNQLRNTFFESCRQAGVGGQMEVGSGLGHDERPADVLVPNWDLGKPAAFDLTVVSLLNQSILNEACVTAGSSARVPEQRKHASNDIKCSELAWSCIPLAVETYGCWGAEGCFHALPLDKIAPNRMPPQHCMVGSTWFLSEQMQGHCYPEHMASALTSQLNYRSRISCSDMVVVYFVCAHLHSSNSVYYLLWCCVQSMFCICYLYQYFICKINIIIIQHTNNNNNNNSWLSH